MIGAKYGFFDLNFRDQATAVIADDHILFVDGLTRSLAGVVRVLATVNQTDLILPMILKVRPDLLFLDLSMPAGSPLDVMPSIRRDFPLTRTIVVSWHTAPDWILRARLAGASAYVTKTASSQELISAIKKVMAGGLHLLSMRLVRKFGSSPPARLA